MSSWPGRGRPKKLSSLDQTHKIPDSRPPLFCLANALSYAIASFLLPFDELLDFSSRQPLFYPRLHPPPTPRQYDIIARVSEGYKTVPRLAILYAQRRGRRDALSHSARAPGARSGKALLSVAIITTPPANLTSPPTPTLPTSAAIPRSPYLLASRLSPGIFRPRAIPVAPLRRDADHDARRAPWEKKKKRKKRGWKKKKG